MQVPSPDSDYDNHSSSLLDQQVEVRDENDLRRKIGGDVKTADRRKRNGESAKRSREKRKTRIEEMENNYVHLEEGHKRLVEENLKLRELVASLGGDLSSIAPIPPLEETNSEDLIISSKKAKHTKLEYRDTTANSFESEVTHNNSQQLELFNPLAVATTVLLLVCFPIMNSLSQMSQESFLAFKAMHLANSPSEDSIGCRNAPQPPLLSKQSLCPQHIPPPPTLADRLLDLMKWNSKPNCWTSRSSYLTDLSYVTTANSNSHIRIHS